MPVWFPKLADEIIKKGKQIESGAERVIVHHAELPGSKTKMYLTQELDTGNVVVDIGSSKHGFADGHLGQPVRLEYKASEVIEPSTTGAGYTTSTGKEVYPGMSKGALKTDKTKKGLKTKEEFWVEEAEWTGGHPENVKFDDSTFNKFGQHGSDFTEVEKFATGKVKSTKPTKKRLQTEYESGKAEADAERWTEEAMDDVDMASGGRVPLVGGKGVLGALPSDNLDNLDNEAMTLEEVAEDTKIDNLLEYLDFIDLMKNRKGTKFYDAVYKPRELEAAQGGRVPFVKGKLAKYATPEGLAKLIEKLFPGTTKLGKTSRPMAEKTQLRKAIADFQEREKVAKAISEGPLPGERAGIDVPDMPAGFKLSREKLKQNFPEIGLDEIDEIMNLDREMQGRVITMLKNRRLDPDLYDELLLKHGDTLKFQGEFDKAIRRKKNASGGRVSLSAGGLAGMLGE